MYSHANKAIWIELNWKGMREREIQKHHWYLCSISNVSPLNKKINREEEKIPVIWREHTQKEKKKNYFH